MSKRVLKKTYQDFREHHSVKELRFWFNKTAHNTYYMVFHLPKWLRMHRNWRTGAFPEKQLGQKIVVIRNKNDAFCKRSAMLKLCQKRNWDIIELPGEHDDIWVRPEKYVNIISKAISND